MVCETIAACEVEEEAAHSGMTPLAFFFSKRKTISLKRMRHDLHCDFKIVWLTCTVCISLSMLSAHLSCLLLIYILANEASRGENYGRDIRHGMMLVKNWMKTKNN